MALNYPRHSLAGGELAPSLWGRTDMAKVQSGCTTMRNCFVNYRGGASSRAGTAFVGPCRQDGNALPPRIIRFQFSLLQSYVLEFGDQYMRVMTNGTYVTETPLVIMAASNLPTCTLTVPGHNFTIGDTVYVASVGGMTKLNGRFFQVGGVTATLVALNDIFGNNVNSTNYGVYTSGGTVARIYTAVSPYAAADLPYLKPVQSADVMSLTCVNQVTLTEYPPYDLSRLGAANWVFTKSRWATSGCGSTSERRLDGRSSRCWRALPAR